MAGEPKSCGSCGAEGAEEDDGLAGEVGGVVVVGAVLMTDS